MSPPLASPALAGPLAAPDRGHRQLSNPRLELSEHGESQRTKHVHRLHPYKGKFIPQLVGWFLDAHTDEFKPEAWFQPGDAVLDPFAGSGTTLVEASELGLHAIGSDVSEFNAWLCNIKLGRHDVDLFDDESQKVLVELELDTMFQPLEHFDRDAASWLADLNRRLFPPSPERKKGHIDREADRAALDAHLPAAVEEYRRMAAHYGVDLSTREDGSFFDRWYLPPVRAQFDLMKRVASGASPAVRDLLRLVLSRTARNCRATRHIDLGTLLEPVAVPYYCRRHWKICRPVMQVARWWDRNRRDTSRRIRRFEEVRTDTRQRCVSGDARDLDYAAALAAADPTLSEIARRRDVRWIFTSPPYIGLIDYHDQHAYAYDLLGFERRDRLEIGAKSGGQTKAARAVYIGSVAQALANAAGVMAGDGDVFVVANDRFDVYPEIAERAGLRVVEEHLRPVLNRTETDTVPYTESVFHMRRPA